MKPLPQLRMENDRLDQVVPVKVAEGYIMRPFRENDLEGLAELYKRCDLGSFSAEQTRNIIPFSQPHRVAIIEHEKRVVASGTFYRDESDESNSVMHLVAVLPEYRRQQLGRSISQQVMRRAYEEGFQRQVLTTDMHRLSAIKVYLILGFRPVFEHPSDPPRWRRIMKKLDLEDKYSQVIYRGKWSLRQRMINEARLFLSDIQANVRGTYFKKSKDLHNRTSTTH